MTQSNRSLSNIQPKERSSKVSVIRKVLRDLILETFFLKWTDYF